MKKRKKKFLPTAANDLSNFPKCSNCARRYEPHYLLAGARRNTFFLLIFFFFSSTLHFLVASSVPRRLPENTAEDTNKFKSADSRPDDATRSQDFAGQDVAEHGVKRTSAHHTNKNNVFDGRAEDDYLLN